MVAASVQNGIKALLQASTRRAALKDAGLLGNEAERSELTLYRTSRRISQASKPRPVQAPQIAVSMENTNQRTSECENEQSWCDTKFVWRTPNKIS